MVDRGLIFNIQRFSLDDGPGIRGTVFLKGCNLRCRWCHNPESIHLQNEIQFWAQKCIACGKCIDCCPVQAHQVKAGLRVFAREKCQCCGLCVETCNTGALLTAGKTMTVYEVIAEVEKDRPFYRHSGGGVTFSGGEPLLQIDFLKALLMECRNKGFHTAVDTAGNVPWEFFTTVLPFVDLFLYDVKVLSEVEHRAMTGADNRLILENLKRLAGSGAEIWVRIPVIPGVNDTVAAMAQIATWIQGLTRIKRVELLPFHRLGEGKYQSLGLSYDYHDCPLPVEDLPDQFIAIFQERGLPVKRG